MSGQNYLSFPWQFLVTNLYVALPVLEKIQDAGNLAYFVIAQKIISSECGLYAALQKTNNQTTPTKQQKPTKQNTPTTFLNPSKLQLICASDLRTMIHFLNVFRF